MSYQCIGRSRVGAELVRCTNESETPTNPDKPDWGWLCGACANAPAARNSPMTEAINVGATQSDPEEYKDQAESGFMSGMRCSDLHGEE